MSEETGEVRIIGADPERVVSVTVGDLETLLDDGMDVEAGFIGIGTVTIHERTCHPISSQDALPDKDRKSISEELTKNHAFGLLRFCSVCHSPLGRSDALDSFCSRCGSRVVGDDD